MSERNIDDSDSRGFWQDRAARTTRSGCFWIPGERVAMGDQTYQHGPLFASWGAPEHVTRPYPLVLIHGGG